MTTMALVHAILTVALVALGRTAVNAASTTCTDSDDKWLDMYSKNCAWYQHNYREWDDDTNGIPYACENGAPMKDFDWYPKRESQGNVYNTALYICCACGGGLTSHPSQAAKQNPHANDSDSDDDDDSTFCPRGMARRGWCSRESASGGTHEVMSGAARETATGGSNPLANGVPQGAVVGDPHFVGFDGTAFDYHGAPGAAFNVFSTPDMLVNARLVPELVNGLTYIGAIGIHTPAGVRAKVFALPESRSLAVELDGRPTDAETSSVKDVTVDLSDPERVVLILPGVEIQCRLHKREFIDISSVAVSPALVGDMHGVLGQTLLSDRGYEGFKGSDEDYFVTDLWSGDFKFTTFKTSTGSAPRKNIRMRPPATIGGQYVTAAVLNVD